MTPALEKLERAAANLLAASGHDLPEAAVWQALAAVLHDFQGALARLEAGLLLSAKPILSVAEARAMAGFESNSAFYRWATTWGVTHSGGSRWPRHRVLAGLEKEARGMVRKRAVADRRPAVQHGRAA